ncbi:MAG: hypothetical protein V4574_18050 [Pseudomonadota bacterium]
MKIFPLIAAAAVALVMPAAASAAPAPSAPAALVASAVATQSVRVSINDQRRGHGRRAHWRRVCTNKWRHGHRVRTCRRVRSWNRW